MTALKIVREMTIYDWFGNCQKNYEKGHIRNTNIKYTIIIVVKYTIEEYVAFGVQSHENYNKNYTDHSPFQFSL